MHQLANCRLAAQRARTERDETERATSEDGEKGKRERGAPERVWKRETRTKEGSDVEIETKIVKSFEYYIINIIVDVRSN